jgi:hypothetical protein
LDSGEVDGVLIDETLITNERWIPLDGLSSLEGWKSYKKDFLGLRGPDDREFTAIASMADPDAARGRTEILNALDDVLAHSAIVPNLIPKLRKTFWQPDQEGAPNVRKSTKVDAGGVAQ